MAIVRHILSDGQAVEDLSGHVVKVTEAKAVYDLIHTINKASGRKSDNEKQKKKVSE